MRSLLAGIAMGAAVLAHAQPYPTRPITVISSAAIASSGDAGLRLISNRMSTALGQPVVIEVRGGAAGALAAQPVMKAAPDGHTMLFGTTGSFVFARYLMANLPFDITKDFAPVSLAMSAGAVFAVHNNVPVNSYQELVEYSKKNPGKLSYASTGVGSIFHLLGEALKIHTGIDMTHIPYTQPNYPQLLNDWGAGRVEIFLPAYSSLRPLQGKMKAFMVFDRQRMPQLPNVPQVNEMVPKFENVITWWGYFGPAGLPRPVAERFAAEVKRSFEDHSVSSKLDELAMTMVGSTPAELATALKTDLENTARIVKALGIKPQ